jgi:hypothetical protein
VTLRLKWPSTAFAVTRTSPVSVNLMAGAGQGEQDGANPGPARVESVVRIGIRIGDVNSNDLRAGRVRRHYRALA